MPERDVVTGAFSYTGRHIAEALLGQGREVRTLTRRPHPEHPLSAHVDAVQLRFDDSLADALRGADTLYSTYWVRFERRGTTFDRAVANLGVLFGAAAQAGVRRVVHVSVANPDEASPFAYFRGKARAERLLRESGLSHAIVRPTLLFGEDDIVVNDLAWALRRVPLFVVPGDGRCEVQPVSVRDTARVAVELGGLEADVGRDAAGPDRWTFADFVGTIASAVGSRARIRRGPPWAVLTLARIAGILLRDVVLARDELAAMRAGLLVSHEPPVGRERFEDWLGDHAHALGRAYASEIDRNFRDRR